MRVRHAGVLLADVLLDVGSDLPLAEIVATADVGNVTEEELAGVPRDEMGAFRDGHLGGGERPQHVDAPPHPLGDGLCECPPDLIRQALLVEERRAVGGPVEVDVRGLGLGGERSALPCQVLAAGNPLLQVEGQLGRGLLSRHREVVLTSLAQVRGDVDPNGGPLEFRCVWSLEAEVREGAEPESVRRIEPVAKDSGTDAAGREGQDKGADAVDRGAVEHGAELLGTRDDLSHQCGPKPDLQLRSPRGGGLLVLQEAPHRGPVRPDVAVGAPGLSLALHPRVDHVLEPAALPRGLGPRGGEQLVDVKAGPPEEQLELSELDLRGACGTVVLKPPQHSGVPQEGIAALACRGDSGHREGSGFTAT